jgi:hypothetical protein
LPLVSSGIFHTSQEDLQDSGYATGIYSRALYIGRVRVRLSRAVSTGKAEAAMGPILREGLGIDDQCLGLTGLAAEFEQRQKERGTQDPALYPDALEACGQWIMPEFR